MAQCKLCNQHRPLVRAHIIPESLYPFTPGPDRVPLRRLTTVEGDHPGKSRTGDYDPDLLCEECEQRFSPWDNYAHRTLAPKLPDESAIKDPNTGDETVAYVVSNVDYRLLKLFFVSLLWRASATTRPMFQNVKLGPHEAVVADMVRGEKPGEAEDYAVVLSKFDHKAGQTILSPDWTRHDGVRFYRFYLAGYVASIKASQQKTTESLRRIVLAPDQPLYVIAREFLESPEYRELL